MMEAILLAAGDGKRMRSDIPKQFFRIKGKPLFIFSLEQFNRCKEISNIYIACKKDFIDEYDYYIKKYNISNTICIEGGKTRQESVYNALNQINTINVLIHEAARPLISVDFLVEILSYKTQYDAVIPTVPIKFSVAIGDEFMERELDRSTLHNIQLPQLYNTKLLLNAHNRAICDNYHATEDGMLLFHYGGRVKFVPGRESNIKVTTQLDIEIVEKLLKME